MRRNDLILCHFLGAIFLSAFLLFAIQPMFTKIVLPVLGGAPGVWSVAMVFFQSMLLLGYLYAHILVKFIPLRVAVIIHCLVTASAFISLPIAMATGYGEPSADSQIFWLIGLFAASIGLPFFALSANGPLLQAWFARTGHPHAEDPYFLYSISNLGSLLALLLYPILVEPVFTLSMQTQYWSYGYTVLLLLLAFLVLVFLTQKKDILINEISGEQTITWQRRLIWIALAAIPSALLIAVTAHISTDVAAVPFLWVVPLIIYLLSFILVFARKPQISQRVIVIVLPFAATPLLLLLMSKYTIPLPATLIVHLFAFFILAMLCHGRLAEERPQAAQLTEFYFFLSLGGLIGGLFAGLVAPNIFNSVIEYPLLVGAALLAWPNLRQNFNAGWQRDTMFAFGALTAAAILGIILKGEFNHKIIWIIMSILIAGILIVDRHKPVRFIILAIGALALAPFLRNDNGYTLTKRSFFGVHKVYESSDGHYLILEHGTTIHGAQSKIVGMEREPLTYYGKDNNFGQVLRGMRLLLPLQRIGAVGLGTGSMACHVIPGEDITFFEIDKTVVDLANTEFTFLKNCAPNARIVVGDARLTLKNEPDGIYDLLIIDAFTSDAVPVHLLTLEAINLYFSKLTPNGVVLLHISNRNLEMESMLASSAHELGAVALSRNEPSDDEKWKMLIAPSHVVVMARKTDDLGALVTMNGWHILQPSGVPAWRDNFSNVFGAMWRRLNQ
ncbi:MAG: fused MFS/spermidine synthase, partial [Pseudomonadota bacterium]